MPAAPNTVAGEMSVRAAAARLRISDRAIYRLVALGHLRPLLEVGRTMKIDSASVEAYAAARGIPAPAEAVSR